MLWSEIIPLLYNEKNQGSERVHVYPRPTHLTSWQSWNSKPGVKSSNPGFEVSICCFYNLGKAKKKNFRGKTMHQKELYIKWFNIWWIQFLCPKSKRRICLQGTMALQPEQEEEFGGLLYGRLIPVFLRSPKGRQGGAWPLAMTPMFLSLLEIAGLFHSLLERFQGEVYKQVRRMGSKGVWNLPFPIPIPWKLVCFFLKEKKAYFLRLRFQKIFNWKVEIYIYLNLEHKTLLKLRLCIFVIYISQWNYY